MNPQPDQNQPLQNNKNNPHDNCCCFGNDPNEACGYPPKTVRAIISCFIVMISFAAFAFIAVWFTVKEEYTNAMSIVGIMGGELGGVIGYYFGSKQGQKDKKDDTSNNLANMESQQQEEVQNNNEIEMNELNQNNNENMVLPA